MGVFKINALKKAETQKQKKYTILLVDDEESNLDVLESILSEEYFILTARDGQEALELIEREPDPEKIQLIITDQRMPRLSGVDFLEKTLNIIPRTKRIILTGYADLQVVISSINRVHVFQFILKPFERESLLRSVTLALEAYESERVQTRGFREIIGVHPKILAVLDRVMQVADSDASILIRGETGTGKELVARALHDHSSRANKPFVAIHCGALPETLFETELFGHKKGSFTGAQVDRVGRVLKASGGTLFVDEFAEIPLTMQAKLLRFFQFGEFQRVGSDRVEKVDVRIVAASHRDIPKMIQEGRFRQDLYYRLNIVEIDLPPLRERKSDIPLLAESFLKRFWKRQEKPKLTEQFLMILEEYEFPGNVRELVHIIERACLLSKSPQLGPHLLPSEVLKSYGQNNSIIATANVKKIHFNELTNESLKQARQDASRQASDKVERLFLQQLMAANDGQITAAARQAGMQRTYLHRLLSRHRIGKQD